MTRSVGLLAYAGAAAGQNGVRSPESYARPDASSEPRKFDRRPG